MKKILFLFFVLFSFNYFCQSVVLKGKVLNQQGSGIKDVIVVVSTNKQSVLTNDGGEFVFELPKGNYDISFQKIGFSIVKQKLDLQEDKFLEISLKAKVIQLDTLELEFDEVFEDVQKVEMSTEKMTGEEIKQIPAFLGEPDVINAIKLLPGITTTGEASVGFNVRGGNVDQNLILCDNANIYASSHLLGFFSVFNPDAVESLTLYKGGMPAYYGERVSSVLTITQRSGDFQKYHLDGGIGLVSSRLTFGGPILKNKMSFIVSGRRTYFDRFFFLAPEKEVRKSSAYFYDLNMKLDWIVNAKNDLTFTLYRGRDAVKFGSEFDKEDIKFSWGNTFGVLNWENRFADNWKLNTSFSNTDYSYGFFIYDFDWVARINTLTQKIDFEYDGISKHQFKFGLQNNNHFFRPGEINFKNGSEFGPGESVETNVTVPNEQAMEQALFFQDKIEVSKKVDLQMGLRYSIYSSLGSAKEYIYDPLKTKSLKNIIDSVQFGKNKITKTYHGLEPRLNAVYKIDSISSFKMAYNRSFQYMQLITNTTTGLPTDVWKSADYHIKPMVGNQIGIGYVRGLFKNKFELTAETYFKYLKNNIDYKDNSNILLNKNIETDVLAGNGRSYGLELQLRKRHGKINGWINYTLSRSETRIKSDIKQDNINDGYWYKAAWNIPHTLNVVLNYKASQRITLNATFKYASGRPITVPTGKFESNENIYYIYSKRNDFRLTDYHRLDLGVELGGKKNPIRKYHKYWTFNVINVYARRNAFAYIFDQDYQYVSTNTGSSTINKARVTKLSIIGAIVPSATFNFKF